MEADVGARWNFILIKHLISDQFVKSSSENPIRSRSNYFVITFNFCCWKFNFYSCATHCSAIVVVYDVKNTLKASWNWKTKKVSVKKGPNWIITKRQWTHHPQFTRKLCENNEVEWQRNSARLLNSLIRVIVRRRKHTKKESNKLFQLHVFFLFKVQRQNSNRDFR